MANDRVVLRPHNFIPYTLVPNFFIDHALVKSNGEFIKVYLVLLRFMSVGQLDFDLSQIADHLLMTESDVLRALNYFQHEQLLTLTYSGNRLKEIHLVHQALTDTIYSPKYSTPTKASDTNGQFEPSSFEGHRFKAPSYEAPIYDTPSYVVPEVVYKEDTPQVMTKSDITEIPSSNLKVISSRPEYTMKDVALFAEEEEFSQLLYIVQKYLGKTLSANEVKIIISFHDWLGLPIDVIELLIEYCVSNDHRNLRYIEKVAIDWADHGITTLEKAKVRTETYHKSYFVILKAYGITDRSPTPNQIKLMDKWLNTYGFDISIIQEACERTIQQINKAEMRYTDTILEHWYKNSVTSPNDILELDKKAPKESKKVVSKAPASTSTAPNKFSNYNQREYDYDALEKKALEMRLKETNNKRYSS